jgi:hypothetical protein
MTNGTVHINGAKSEPQSLGTEKNGPSQQPSLETLELASFRKMAEADQVPSMRPGRTSFSRNTLIARNYGITLNG